MLNKTGFLYTNHVDTYWLKTTDEDFYRRNWAIKLQRYNDNLYVFEEDGIGAVNHLDKYPITTQDYYYADGRLLLDGMHPERRLMHVNQLTNPTKLDGYWWNIRYTGRIIETGLFTVVLDAFDTARDRPIREKLLYSLWEFQQLFRKDEQAETDFYVRCLDD